MAVDPERRRWALVAMLVSLATLLVFLTLLAISLRGLSLFGDSAGNIRLEGVSLRPSDSGQWYLSASVDIALPEPIRAGLDSGVPLDFLLTFEFQRLRKYWPDETLARYQHRFRLTYYELTRHYRVYAVASDSSHNFRSLSAALAGLGDFDRLPIVLDIDKQQNIEVRAAIASEDATVIAKVDFRLDSRSLPLPLQPFIASSWRLSSREYQWQVN